MATGHADGWNAVACEMKGNPFADWTMAEVEAHNRRVLKQYGSAPDRLPSSPEPEQAVCHESVGPPPGKESHPGRCIVRITSFRRKLLDPDNLAGGVKYFVDALRYEKIIQNDRLEDIELHTSQVQVSHRRDERTEIEVSNVDHFVENQ